MIAMVVITVMVAMLLMMMVVVAALCRLTVTGLVALLAYRAVQEMSLMSR